MRRSTIIHTSEAEAVATARGIIIGASAACIFWAVVDVTIIMITVAVTR